MSFLGIFGRNGEGIAWAWTVILKSNSFCRACEMLSADSHSVFLVTGGRAGPQDHIDLRSLELTCQGQVAGHWHSWRQNLPFQSCEWFFPTSLLPLGIQDTQSSLNLHALICSGLGLGLFPQDTYMMWWGPELFVKIQFRSPKEVKVTVPGRCLAQGLVTDCRRWLCNLIFIGPCINESWSCESTWSIQDQTQRQGYARKWPLGSPVEGAPQALPFRIHLHVRGEATVLVG